MSTFAKIMQFFLTVMLICILVFLIFINFKSDEFLKASLTNILTISVAIAFSFYLSNNNNNKRKTKEVAEKIIIKLEALITSEKAYVITSTTDIAYVNMVNRRISNLIDELQRTKNLIKNEDIEYICNQFKEYKDFIGENTSNIEYLSNSTNALQKYIFNIESRCDKILLYLYIK